ncbi:hypothetical protein HDU76_000336 [Blyttiomyces sp. JEL0837]|nr:hypothetical protein HDU76_000336 [Blyttiomyces sp. JEL0837]
MGRRKEKSRFPVARIKKIMRTDDDVGKVAQVTPILISRALELFMQSLIDDACKETINRNAKKLTGSHLKLAIFNNPKFDFLKDLVANLPDPIDTQVEGAAGEDSATSAAPKSFTKSRAPRSRGSRGAGGKSAKAEDGGDE